MNGTDVESAWWDPVVVGDGDHHRFVVGPRRIWVRRQGRDLGWTHTPEPEAERPDAEPLAEEALDAMAWQRWAIDRDQASVRLLPVLYDLALVVRSHQMLRIAPQVTVRYYIGIPCLLRLELAGDPRLTLGELPSIELSRTWFGEPTDGKLCLALKSRARRRLDEIEQEPHRILCPVEIHNATAEAFSFERACVPVEHCAVFYGGGRLWASSVRITYRGPEAENQIEVENHAPRETGDAAVELGPARKPGGKRGGLLTLSGLRGAWMSR